MPTILELFRGSTKDILPNIPNQIPVQQKFKGSPQESAVKSDRDTLIEQELTGIRIRSAVELNNPLIYGNQAIRIATRSTSDVEKMKQGTGGAAGDGGLIGKGLGAITGGKFGKFVFGGKVTSLNQARDGINTRLGIPQNLIPTAVKNTGDLQNGLEPDTMITLGKIQKENKSTELGKFLKQTGGGNPKTLGRQILGQGITLGKDKLRKALFGNPNALGANNASSIDSFSGTDSGGKMPANGGWEYSSKLPYSYQINREKFSDKKIDGVEESASTEITKKVTQLRLDAKKKLGEAASNATSLLKKKLKGTESKPEIDKAVESQTKETSATSKLYEEKNNKLIERSSVETNLKLPGLGKTTELKKDVNDKEESKKPLGLPEGVSKPKLTGTESKPEIDKAVESETKETSDTPTTYTERLKNYKTEDVSTRIDLSLVSPIKGIDRRKTKGRFGTTEYALFDPKNTTGGFSPNDPTRPYSGVVGTTKKYTLSTKYGLTNESDSLNMTKPGAAVSDDSDLIPLKMSSVSDTSEFVQFRTLITGLTETISPSWDSSKFVGNPYNFYTYSGVERSVSFTLKVYCMNITELGLMWERLNWLTARTYPTIVNKVVEAPFMKLTIGSIYKSRVGFINSLSYTINDDVTWETDVKDSYLPKVVDIQLEYKLVESAGVELGSFYNYELSSDAVKGINNKRAEQKDNVVGTDPITNPQPATGVDFKKVQGNADTKPPTPPKVDNTGVEQTAPPPTPTDNTPKNIDTGKPVETPKAAEQPATVSQSTAKAETDYAVKRAEAEKKYTNQGYPEWLAKRLGMFEAGGRDIKDVQKIDEINYYVEMEMRDGEIREQVHYAYMIPAIGVDSKPTGEMRQTSSAVSYEKWVSDNGGKDPMNKFFSKEQMDRMESSNQPKTTLLF
jgi:hypothetical protein